ncbi:MAG TPA: hypothetical protein VJN01_00795 [Xanthomonadales bacterium]|nr:hypothetical protein [Xanthomonadales bacterium]
MKLIGKLTAIVPVLALSLGASLALAQEAAAPAEKPSISASQTVQLTAVVESINQETRAVVLRTPDGKLQELTVGPEARNLPQVQAGDTVTAEFVRKVDVQVYADDGSELGSGAMAAAGRTEEGQMPGGMAVQTEVVTARVAAISIENNTFQLQWPDGTIEEYVAQNPDNLKLAAVGDIVMITYTEAVGIVVERPTAE